MDLYRDRETSLGMNRRITIIMVLTVFLSYRNSTTGNPNDNRRDGAGISAKPGNFRPGNRIMRLEECMKPFSGPFRMGIFKKIINPFHYGCELSNSANIG